ncbi:hypothetical protein ACE1TI_17260 [Alteribacillus sp. JSM 102045]|uniref:hypothetical protein n=1 Tax=Alteribacillus sp. JSM 102045 TaxID=1562101 RepID=UPI0035C1EF7C
MYNNNNLLRVGLAAILLTTVYTAILASIQITTKNRVDYLYFLEKIVGEKIEGKGFRE